MTTSPVITLEQKGRVFELSPGTSSEEIDEGLVFVSLQAEVRPQVKLDDKPIDVSWRSREMVAAFTFDLTNQVGFHRLTLTLGARTYSFDFHTSTTKATRDEVLAMAEVCGRYYLGFNRQFVYAAANGERRKILLPQIHFAWLRDRLAEIGALVYSINSRPATTSARATRPSRYAKNMILAKTIRLLQERHDLLEAREDGPITVEEKHYWPAMIVENVRNIGHADVEHATISNFLLRLLKDCNDLRKQVDANTRQEIDVFRSTLSTILQLPVIAKARRLYASTLPRTSMATTIERSDSRYGRLRMLHNEYLADITSSEDYERSIRANVKDISEIYQTFVAHVVGNSLGLAYCSPTHNLRERSADGASMSSPTWSMGFDSHPPRDVLSSWRAKTLRPASERPDISLVGSKADCCLFLDAKFRTSNIANQARQEDLFEMQGYMNSFSVSRGGIIYPGVQPVSITIDSASNRLIELPIRAEFFNSLGSKDAVHSYVKDAINNALRPFDA